MTEAAKVAPGNVAPEKVAYKGPASAYPVPGHRALDDDMLAMLVALTSELTVVRARMDTMERILAQSGVMAEGAVDGFEPDAAATRARAAAAGAVVAAARAPAAPRWANCCRR